MQKPRKTLRKLSLFFTLFGLLIPSISLGGYPVRPATHAGTAAGADLARPHKAQGDPSPHHGAMAGWSQTTYNDWLGNDYHQAAIDVDLWSHANAGDLGTVADGRVLVVLDANGDGHADVAVGTTQQNRLLLGEGQGLFTLVDAGDFDDPSQNTRDLVTFDADGDGDQDLAVLNHGPNALYLNDGAGYFASADSGAFGQPVYWSQDAQSLVALDVDGDGDVDLAAGYDDDPNLLYRNDGTGVFSVISDGDFENAGGGILAPLDADGDGDIDLAVGQSWFSYEEPAPNALYLNDGTGALYRTESGDFEVDDDDTQALLAFDADGDGDVDLAAGNALDRSLYMRQGVPEPDRLYLNDGAGIFTRIDAGDFDDLAFETGDLNGVNVDEDGDLDLVVLDRHGFNRVYLNVGGGPFVEMPAGELANVVGLALVSFDANGDGRPDLAQTGETAGSIFLNQGTENAGIVLAEEGFVKRNAGSFDNVAGPTVAWAAFDGDGDGDTDLAAGHSGIADRFLVNEGSGIFREFEAGDFGEEAGYTSALAAFDADGDGDIDLAAAIPARGFAPPLTPATNILFANDGGGRFVRVEAGDFDDETYYTKALAAFDADGDGDIDLAVGNGHHYGDSYANQLFLNDGRGHFGVVEAGDFDDEAGQTLALITFDADGDDDVDLAVARMSRRELFLNNGNGIFSLGDGGEFDSESIITEALAAFDVDDDGDLDLAAGNGTYPNQLFLNDGSGHFHEAAAGEFGDLDPEQSTSSLVAFDVDGDGDVDLAVGDASRYHNSALYLNDGQGGFTRDTQGDFGATSRSTSALVVLDANGDGDPDLAEGNTEADALFLNDGAGLLIEDPGGDLGDSPSRDTSVLVPFDADGDGDADLATPGGFFLNDGDGWFTREPGRGHVAFDADGDGDDDLAIPGTLYQNDGHAHFTPVSAGDFDGVSGRGLTALDANGDGPVDLVSWGRPSVLYLNDGSGSFILAGDIGREYGIRDLIAFDADGDGDVDLAEAPIEPHVLSLEPNLLYLNDGSGQFIPSEAGAFDDGGTMTHDLLAFDADHDGDLDLAVADNGFERDPWGWVVFPDWLYLNDGQAVFSDGGQLGAARRLGEALEAFDADGDGDLDLAVGNEIVPDYGEENPSRLLLNDGQGRFTEVARPVFLTGSVISLASLDADGDGDNDLAAGRRGQDSLYLFRGLAEQGSVTSLLVDPAALYPAGGGLQAWHSLTVEEALPAGTTMTYDVLDAGGQGVPGFTDLRPDGDGLIWLHELDATAYPAIRLRANLFDLDAGSDYDDRTPRLGAWRLDFRMRNDPAIYPVTFAPRTSYAPLIDGDLGEWPPVESTTLNRSTAATIIGDFSSDADAELTCRSMWDNANLYLGCQVTDDIIVVDSGARFWHDDAVELLFDGKHDGVSFCGDDPCPDDHKYELSADGRFQDYSQPPNPAVRAAVQQHDDGYDLEVAIPQSEFDTVPFQPHTVILGFNLGLIDDDDGGSMEGQLVWSGEHTYGHAWTYGDLRFWPDHGYPPPTGTPTATPTANATPTATPTNTQTPTATPAEFDSYLPLIIRR